MNVASWIDSHARFVPEKVAISCPGREYTYHNLALEVALVSGLLVSHLKIKPGDRIAYLGYNTPELVILLLACARTGAILLPLNWRLTPSEHRFILQDCLPSALFVDEAFTPQVGDNSKDYTTTKRYSYADNDDRFESVNRLLTEADPVEGSGSKAGYDSLLLLCYTSGTTGRPKGVPLTYGSLIASTNDWLDINGPLVLSESVDLHWLPNSHIFGWGALGLGNILGFTSYLTNPLEVLQLLPEIKPHLFMSVPGYFEKLFQLTISSSENEDEQLETLRKLIGGRITFLLSGGAGLKREVKEFFLKAGMWITEGYGLTECSPTLTMNRHNDYNFDSVGKPYPCVDIKLAKDGEILARGPVVFQGYYKDPEATKEVFTQDGWLRTGDVGQWLDGGFLKIIGRKKEIIVTSGGKNIPPENIELKFRDNPYIEHLVVYGDGKKYLVAAVTLSRSIVEQWAKENSVTFDSWEELCVSPTVEELVQESINLLNSELASFETIKYFRIIPENFTPLNGLLTSSLKLRRKKVYEYYKEELEALYCERPALLQEEG